MNHSGVGGKGGGILEFKCKDTGGRYPHQFEIQLPALEAAREQTQHLESVHGAAAENRRTTSRRLSPHFKSLIEIIKKSRAKSTTRKFKAL
jgi:hypothetical protein